VGGTQFVVDENDATVTIDGACEFTRGMLRNSERAVEHPDMTEELAEVLSTWIVEVEYEIRTGVTID
jgi:hypothetical protein